MALLAKVGAFNTGTGAAGTTIALDTTDPRAGAFTAKAIILWHSGRTETVDTVGRQTFQRGIGFACGASDRHCHGSLSQDAAAAAVTNHAFRNDACIVSTTIADAIDGLLDVQSMSLGTSTLIIDDPFAASLRCHYLALGGDSLTNAVTGEFQKPASTTPQTQDITGLTFQPDSLILIEASAGSGALPILAVDSRHGIGFAASSSQRGVAVFSGDDAGVTMRTCRYIQDTQICGGLNTTANGLVDIADFVQFNSDGFRLNWTTTSATNRWFFYLAMKGTNMQVGSLLTQTDTTTPIVVSSLPYQPAAVMLITAGSAESTAGTTQTDDIWGIGAFTDPNNRGAQATSDQNAAADAVVATAVDHDECLITLTNAGAINGLMDCQSVQGNGFTCIMDDADSSQNFVLWAAFGPADPYPLGYHLNQPTNSLLRM